MSGSGSGVGNGTGCDMSVGVKGGVWDGNADEGRDGTEMRDVEE